MTSSPLYSTNEIRKKIGYYPILNESLPIELQAKILRSNGFSYREISQILDISYSYAYKLVNRSRQSLTKLLNQLEDLGLFEE